jgi:hypothetical protein
MVQRHTKRKYSQINAQKKNHLTHTSKMASLKITKLNILSKLVVFWETKTKIVYGVDGLERVSKIDKETCQNRDPFSRVLSP